MSYHIDLLVINEASFPITKENIKAEMTALHEQISRFSLKLYGKSLSSIFFSFFFQFQISPPPPLQSVSLANSFLQSFIFEGIIPLLDYQILFFFQISRRFQKIVYIMHNSNITYSFIAFNLLIFLYVEIFSEIGYLIAHMQSFQRCSFRLGKVSSFYLDLKLRKFLVN